MNAEHRVRRLEAAFSPPPCVTCWWWERTPLVTGSGGSQSHPDVCPTCGHQREATIEVHIDDDVNLI